jgi:23S rRNA pseudouridine1911/1915/1917 synthase
VKEKDDENIFLKFSFEADRGQQPLRLDKFIAVRVEGASRAKVQEGIANGLVLVNGKTEKSNYKVKAGDVIEIFSHKEPQKLEVLPEKMELDFVYEDDELAVINKPAGLVVHPGHGNFTGTLVNGLAWHFDSGVVSQNERPWLVHRIDKNTSGLLVVAKTERALSSLSKQFKDHSIHRRYLALVWGSFDEPEGTITGHIGRSAQDRKKFTVYPEGDHGKHAITHYKVIENFTYTSLVECILETGRTHQIRVHMKYIGHTLFSDHDYGGDRILKGVVFSRYKQFVENCFQILPRQALHARELGFVHPASGQTMRFSAELPTDFEQVLEKWRKVSKAYDFAETD